MFQFSSDVSLSHWPKETYDHNPKREWPEWDGVVLNSVGKSPSEIHSNTCQDGLVKGMLQFYPDPFENPSSPTLKELDFYHIQVIKQIRRIWGMTNIPISMDPCLCVQGLWADEYKFNAANKLKCAGNSHCGAGINSGSVPLDFNVRQSYLKHTKEYRDDNNKPIVIRGDGTCNLFKNGNPGGDRSEGVAGTSTSKIWPERLQNVFCLFLKEGFTGHGGPLATRTRFCPSFWINEKSISIRIKWSSKSAFTDGDYMLLY
jgi:hypothetical protein